MVLTLNPQNLHQPVHGAVPVPFRYHNEDDEEDDESSLSLTGLAVFAGTARCSELPFQQVMQALSYSCASTMPE